MQSGEACQDRQQVANFSHQGSTDSRHASTCHLQELIYSESVPARSGGGARRSNCTAGCTHRAAGVGVGVGRLCATTQAQRLGREAPRAIGKQGSRQVQGLRSCKSRSTRQGGSRRQRQAPFSRSLLSSQFSAEVAETKCVCVWYVYVCTYTIFSLAWSWRLQTRAPLQPPVSRPTWRYLMPETSRLQQPSARTSGNTVSQRATANAPEPPAHEHCATSYV